MQEQPSTTIRKPMQVIQRMHDRLYATTRRWRFIAHIGNVTDKILTIIGITMYHLQEINPIGRLFLGESVSFFGIIAFYLYGVLVIEYLHKNKPKILPFSAILLMVAVGVNAYLILFGGA